MLHHGDHHSNARAVLAFLVLVLAVLVLMVFATNSDDIISSGNFNMFFVLTGVAFVSLVSLLYFAGKPSSGVSSVKKSTKSKKRSR